MMRVGLALGGERPVAWIRGQAHRLEAVELPAILDEVRRLARASRADLHVALLPPLVEIKRLGFPPLARRELETVLARDGDRWFALWAEAFTASAERRGHAVVLAAAADAGLLEELHRETERVGWCVRSIVPAYETWLAWVRSEPSLRKLQRAAIVIELAASIEVVIVERGVTQLVRRLSPRVSASELADAVGMDAEHDVVVVLLAEPARQAELADALQPHGVRTIAAAATDNESPEAIAARLAVRTSGLALVPGSLQQAIDGRVRRLTRIMAGSAAALVMLTAGLEWWGTARELDRVLARRQALRAPVARAMAVRTALDEWQARLEALRAGETGRPRWPAVFAELADHLPADAHLSSLRGTADSLVVEGVAAEANTALQSLRRAPKVEGLRALAPIRQEIRDSGPTREQFLVGMRLRRTDIEAVEAP